MDDIPEDELRRYVHDFLKDFKELVDSGRFFVKERAKNRDSLLELGLTDRQRKEIILSLSVSDFSSGPHQDKYKPGIYWEFGKLIDAVEIYVKLKIAGQPGAENAICFSFHKAERPLRYPFEE